MNQFLKLASFNGKSLIPRGTEKIMSNRTKNISVQKTGRKKYATRCSATK